MLVLVAEDETLIALSLETLLADTGHEILGPAASAKNAAALAERARPDLAFIDINLKDGTTGIDLARLLRDRWDVPSILISAHAAAVVHAGMAVGVVRKPFTLDEVQRALSSAKRAVEGGKPRRQAVQRSAAS